MAGSRIHHPCSHPSKNVCHLSDVCLETLPEAGEGTGLSAGGGSGHVITAQLTASGRAWAERRAGLEGSSSGMGIKPLPPLPAGILLEVLAPYLSRYPHVAAGLSWSSESQGMYEMYPVTWGRVSLPRTGQKPAAAPAAAPR